MLIEHKVKRPGGSDHRIDGTTYEFREDKEGRHVCEVKNAEHAKRFLSISTFVKVGGGSTKGAYGKDAGQGNEGNDEQAGEESAPEAPADDGGDELSSMSKAELFAKAKDMGLDVNARDAKPDLIAAIEAAEG